MGKYDERHDEFVNAYSNCRSDVEAAEMLSISVGSFRHWRKSNGLPAKLASGQRPNLAAPSVEETAAQALDEHEEVVQRAQDLVDEIDEELFADGQFVMQIDMREALSQQAEELRRLVFESTLALESCEDLILRLNRIHGVEEVEEDDEDL